MTGNYYAGGLVGWNAGTLTTSSATGRVSGSSEVGGLVGRNAGTITTSSATVHVSVHNLPRDVGGLVGRNQGTIRGSYATGQVSGSLGYHVGGLVGRNAGTITASYATGRVSGRAWHVGGLVGQNAGTITASYATGRVSGYRAVGGLVGFAYASHDQPQLLGHDDLGPHDERWGDRPAQPAVTDAHRLQRDLCGLESGPGRRYHA